MAFRILGGIIALLTIPVIVVRIAQGKIDFMIVNSVFIGAVFAAYAIGGQPMLVKRFPGLFATKKPVQDPMQMPVETKDNAEPKI